MDLDEGAEQKQHHAANRDENDEMGWGLGLEGMDAEEEDHTSRRAARQHDHPRGVAGGTNGSARKRSAGVEEDGFGIGDDASRKRAKTGHAHSNGDSKAGFFPASVGARPAHPSAAAAAAGLGGGDVPEFQFPEAGVDGARLGTSNKEYLPLDELDQRLDAYEALPEGDRWCPFCRVTAFANAKRQNSLRSTGSEMQFDLIIREIDSIPANNMLGDWRVWMYAVKAAWDLRIRPHIKKEERFGIREDAPEWTVDAILYHYCREVINDRTIEVSQIRDLHIILTRVKRELRTRGADGNVTLNHRLLPAYLSFSKELRSRLKEYKGHR